MNKIEFKLLGGVECRFANGDNVNLRSGNALLLFAYLAHAPDKPHPREKLRNLLWSNRSEEQSQNSLRQALSTIRKALGEDAKEYIDSDRIAVSVSSELVHVDTLEFEKLACASDVESLDQAMRLYQGEFMQGAAAKDAMFQQWLSTERAKYSRVLTQATLRLCQQYQLSSQFSLAIEAAERLVEQDPLAETGWRELMLAYQGNGQSNHALMTFKRCADYLAAELGVEPDTKTAALRDSIKQKNTSSEDETQPEDGSDRAPVFQVSKPVLAHKHARTSSNASSTSGDNSILVLPFDNLSGDKDQEFFSDGITESIIYNLSHFRELKVKSRNSSFAFKEQLKSFGEISKELKVDYIVEGSVRQAKQRMRITVQLFEASSGNQIWGNRYDAETEEVFELEEELCRSIAATVTGRIESDLQRAVISQTKGDQESYELLLSGIHHYYRFTSHDLVTARERLEQCLGKDPDNVRAHCFLYFCHSMEWTERWTLDPLTSFETANHHSAKALELAPDSALAQRQRADMLLLRRQYYEAVLHINKALQINPNDADAYATRSFILGMMGEFEAAIDTAIVCRQLDPYHPWVDWIESEMLLNCGRHDEAIKMLLATGPLPISMQAVLAICYVRTGEHAKAQETVKSLLDKADEEMLSKPANEEQWHQYWRETGPYQDESVNDGLFESLLQAGLCGASKNKRSSVYYLR